MKKLIALLVMLSIHTLALCAEDCPSSVKSLSPVVAARAVTITDPATSSLMATEVTAAAPVRHDVLVLYTDAAIALKGMDALITKTHANFNWTNQAYVNSDVNLEVVPVGMLRSPMQESGAGLLATQDALTKNAEIKALRNELGADLVLLISTDTGGGYLGVAGMQWAWSGGRLTYLEAFATIKLGGWDANTNAHEIGHMQGLVHERESTCSTCGGGAYNYGYKVCAADGFRTVMSYQCGSATGFSVPRMQFFSHPYKYYNGYPTGIDPAVDPANAAWAARQLNENAPIIANFRNPPGTEPTPEPTPTAPLPPTGLTAVAMTGGAQLSWTPGDDRATSFVIERASRHPKNGRWVKSAVIATVAGTTTSYFDAVKPGLYRYTIYAQNAYGSSTKTGPAQVTVL